MTLLTAACGDDGPVPTAPDDSAFPDLSAQQDRGPLERVQFIHWKKGYGMSEAEPAFIEAPSSCYAFIAQGARWKTVEPWEVRSGTSDDGIGASAVKSRTNAGITEWESHLSPSGNILGAGSLGGTPVNLSAPDNHNVVEFGNDPRAGVIAVTNVWGFFSGPVANRQIVEWDMILDRDFTWSTSGEAGKMDLRNILTHELGHAMGMAHPSDTCTLETMYRFASEGETKKRTLHSGDIAGINALY
jgi:hypothetical protein